MDTMGQPARWAVSFYQDAREQRRVEQWLDTLDAVDRRRIWGYFRLLAAYGTGLAMPHCRHLRGKIFELRIAAGKRDYRVLYFATAGQRFILLHAFSKQTEKTPAREIEAAERRMADYIARQSEGG